MNIKIIAIGRDKKGEYAGLIRHYTKQLPWKLEVIEKQPKKLSALLQERYKEEAELLRKAAEGVDIMIALDERGKQLTSMQFAQKLEAYQQDNQQNIAFLIGGADGLETGLREECALKIAFGAMTWPHQMVRLMLVEQLYRAHSILTDHPYHREG